MIRLNDVYGKIVDGKLVEAPKDFDGIMNYNADPVRLVADGWKLIKWAPPVASELYTATYEEQETVIVESFVYASVDQIRQFREAAYKEHSDSLYLAYQKYLARGESEKAEIKRSEWLAKIAEIEATYPYQPI